MELISQIRQIYDNYDIETEILAASIRHPQHMVQALLIGADCGTLPPKVLYQLLEHPLDGQGPRRLPGGLEIPREGSLAANGESMADPMMSPRKFRPMLLWAASMAVPLGACGGGEDTLDSALALETIAPATLPEQAGTEPRQHQSAEISGSRSTAIVEAAARVAPAVVSVNVIRTEQVQTRSLLRPLSDASNPAQPRLGIRIHRQW